MVNSCVPSALITIVSARACSKLNPISPLSSQPLASPDLTDRSFPHTPLMPILVVNSTNTGKGALQYTEMCHGSRIVEVSDNLHLAIVLITEFASTNALYQQGSVTIKILPNNILLEIFSFYMEEISEPWEARVFEWIHAWITLVHVSQRWWDLAFMSSCRLNLQILCTNRRPARDMLDVWPTLPLVIWYQETGNGHSLSRMEAQDDTDNIIYALRHRNHMSQVFLENLPLSVLDRLVPTMQESFPALTCLDIELMDGEPPLVLQDLFLGGSAPCLRSLHFHGIRFPALQKLLLSANNLVNLKLLTIPVSAYISPEAMSTLLPSFPRLEVFYLGFQHPAMDPPPVIQHPPVERYENPR
jgi:hypothetical protein